jgi:hypothetical protein
MGKGSAFSLLLAWPAFFLPNMLVIVGVMGVKKTAVFCGIIVILSTIAGMTYGWITGWDETKWGSSGQFSLGKPDLRGYLCPTKY